MKSRLIVDNNFHSLEYTSSLNKVFLIIRTFTYGLNLEKIEKEINPLGFQYEMHIKYAFKKDDLMEYGLIFTFTF